MKYYDTRCPYSMSHEENIGHMKEKYSTSHSCNKCDHKFKKYSDSRCTNSMYMKII